PGLLGARGRRLEREELGETVTEGVVVLRTFEASFYGAADAARLLRNAADDGIGLPAESEARAMPGVQGRLAVRLARQGQEASRGGHAPGADEDGAVVER